MSHEHPKRPTLDRTRPVRSWSAALGAPVGTATSGEAPKTDAKRRPGLEDAVRRSVDLGYRVLDDYMQQGQRAAKVLSEGKLSAEVISNEMNDLGARIARYASDFFGAWVELLELAAVGSAARQSAADGGAHRPEGAAAPSPPAPPSSGAIRVAVVAGRPVEVALDFRGERLTGALRAHDLRSADARKPRLTDVVIAQDGTDATPVVRIRVPDDHPEGAYEGLLIDEATNRPVGSVRLVVSGARQAARARRGRPPRLPRRTTRGRR